MSGNDGGDDGSKPKGRMRLNQGAAGRMIAFQLNQNSRGRGRGKGSRGGKGGKEKKTFPAHWGKPPMRQTKDLVQWPGGYGRGSGTVRNWIAQKMAEDAAGRGAAGVGAAAAAAAAAGGGRQEESPSLPSNRNSSPVAASPAKRADALDAELHALQKYVKAITAQLQAVVQRTSALALAAGGQEKGKGKGRGGGGGKEKHSATRPKPFPDHWGKPPMRQTRDLVQWPGGYGRGSGTVRKWIEQNMAEDAAGCEEKGKAKAEPKHSKQKQTAEKEAPSPLPPTPADAEAKAGVDPGGTDADAEAPTSTLPRGTLQKIQTQIEYYVSCLSCLCCSS